MLTGAEIAKLGRWSLCLLLVGCGGRTLDDGVYEADGASSDGASCSYRGQTYSDGSPVNGVCFCFCNRGRIECEPGCSSPSGGASSGGTAGGGTTIFGGATSSGGTTSASGSGTIGATGGTIGTGAVAGTGVGATGGVATAGSTGVGGEAGFETGGTTGGFGGMPVICSPAVATATGNQPLIDAMEDGDIYISPFEGRSGTWYAYNDGSKTGFQRPMPPSFSMDRGGPDPSGGKIVANTQGKGFSSWGAGMGFVFNQGCSYNAKVYSGITFYARSELGPTSIYFLVGTSATTPIDAGGNCSGVCYDDFQLEIGLDRGWQKFTIPFNTLNQQGWGTPVFFDRTTLVNVNFQTIPGGGESFSFSVDSISFY